MYEKQIAKGVEWLDKNYGREVWLNAIDVNNLDLKHTNTCMIGQLEGSFNDFTANDKLDFLGGLLPWVKNQTWAKNRGFYVKGKSWTRVWQIGYETLTTEWKDKIAELKGPYLEPIVSPVQMKDLEAIPVRKQK